MKRAQPRETLAARELLLEDGLARVAAELRLLEPSHLIAFIEHERIEILAQLVNCCTELFYRRGTFRFGLSGTVDLDWDRPPTIALDLEFRNMGVEVYFRLILSAAAAAVEIDYIAFGTEGSPQGNTDRLAHAITDARLTAGAGEAAFAGDESHAQD